MKQEKTGEKTKKIDAKQKKGKGDGENNINRPFVPKNSPPYLLSHMSFIDHFCDPKGNGVEEREGSGGKGGGRRRRGRNWEGGGESERGGELDFQGLFCRPGMVDRTGFGYLIPSFDAKEKKKKQKKKHIII